MIFSPFLSPFPTHRLAQRRVKKKDLGQVDHATISYRPFRKNFYVESPEISRMSEEEVRAYRAELDGIKIRGLRCPRPIRKWTQCGLDQRILDIINKRLGYERPTPIQAQAIPAIMSGRDLIGIAKTGSGKTIAFLLPMLRHVLDQPRLSINEGPIALIMTPTRELAMQTFVECRRFTSVLGLRVVCAYGGAPIKEQIGDLKRGAEVLICTPGRLIDLLLANSGRVTNLRRVTYLVLDEADRMFDMGFGPQVLKIIATIRPDKQVVLFSATFPQTMEGLARKILIRPLEIVVGARSVVSTDVEQMVEMISEESKFNKLLDILGRWYETKTSRILIFVDRQEAADSLLKDLIRRGYHCNSLHGGKDQADRDCAIADFKAGNIPILVATSVAARGLDVKDLKLVINYECPNHMEDYVHRVGRTGRAGNRGTAITLISPEQERYAPEIVKALRASRVHIPDALLQLAEGFQEKLRAGQASTVGSGFGGKGLERIDEEHERTRKTQKILLAADREDEDDADEEEAEELKEAIASKKAKVEPPKSTPTTATGTLSLSASSKSTAASSSNSAISPSLKAVISNPEVQVILRRINQRVGGGSEPVLDPLTALNARYKSTTSPASEVMTVYERPAGPGIPPRPKAYYAELELNDYPQAARFRVTQKDAVSALMEMTGAALTVKGEYIPPGRAPKEGQRKLYIRIDADNEAAVEKALKEMRKAIFETISEAAERDSASSHRYNI